MQRKHVLVVGGPNSTLDKVEGLGVRYSMMQLPALAEARQFGNAVRYAAMDYRDVEEALSIARAWHSIDPFDAVISFTEYGLDPASRCARELGIPGDNLPAVALTRDKTRTRDLLDRHGLSPVRYRVCVRVEEARDFLRELAGRPIVLKPCDGGLSEGVVLVEDEERLADRWAWTSAATTGPVLAEEFLDGPEYSVESISFGGKHEIAMITEKVTTKPPRFIELGHQVPARLDGETSGRIEEIVTTFLTLIEQRTGPAHTEIRLTDTGPRIIESQTRIGGDQVWELCELVSGVDLMSETIAMLVDLPLPARTPVAAAAAIRFFAYENVRILTAPDIAAPRRGPGVARIVCTLAPGQKLGPLRSSTSRQGYVLCTAEDTDQAIARAEAARAGVRVDLAPYRVSPT